MVFVPWVEQSVVQTVAPAAEPISLADAKKHARILHDEEDDVILELIRAAREYVEIYLARQLVTATYEYRLDRFPADWGWSYRSAILLPFPPLQTVDSIEYIDSNGVAQVMPAVDYKVDSSREPGRVDPVFGTTWPDTREESNAVTVTFTAGYGSASSVPQGIKQAVRLLFGHIYENREATFENLRERSEPVLLPFGVMSFLQKFRLRQFS